jgi:hypothetical protein
MKRIASEATVPMSKNDADSWCPPAIILPIVDDDVPVPVAKPLEDDEAAVTVWVILVLDDDKLVPVAKPLEDDESSSDCLDDISFIWR